MLRLAQRVLMDGSQANLVEDIKRHLDILPGAACSMPFVI